MLDTAAVVRDIYAALKKYHEKTGTSLSVQMYISDGNIQYSVAVATAPGMVFDFVGGDSMLLWLNDINAEIDPVKSALSRKRAEELAAQQILLDANKAAVALEMSQLGESQRLIDATQAAEKITKDADEKLVILGIAAKESEEEAAAITAAVTEQLERADRKRLRRLLNNIEELKVAADKLLLTAPEVI